MLVHWAAWHVCARHDEVGISSSLSRVTQCTLMDVHLHLGTWLSRHSRLLCFGKDWLPHWRHVKAVPRTCMCKSYMGSLSMQVCLAKLAYECTAMCAHYMPYGNIPTHVHAWTMSLACLACRGAPTATCLQHASASLFFLTFFNQSHIIIFPNTPHTHA